MTRPLTEAERQWHQDVLDGKRDPSTMPDGTRMLVPLTLRDSLARSPSAAVVSDDVARVVDAECARAEMIARLTGNTVDTARLAAATAARVQQDASRVTASPADAVAYNANPVLDAEAATARQTMVDDLRNQGAQDAGKQAA